MIDRIVTAVALASFLVACSPKNSAEVEDQSAPIQDRRSVDISREIAVQRACQVALWMVPAVDTWDFAQGTINFGGKVGDVIQLSQPMTSVHGFLTANDVTPYTIASLTTADGPLVVEVPPATDKLNNFGTFIDAWMVPVADVGEAGADEGKGGKYLFLPAGYEGEVPDEGYFVYQLESYSVSFAFRPVHRGDGTLEEAVEYMRENLRVYPLAEADSPPETVFHDPTGQVWDTLPYFDETYFQDIWNIVQNEPIRERDKAMYGVLREIGIEKGKPLDTSEEWTSIYVEGAQCAFNYLQDIFYTPGKGLYPYYGDDNQWGAFAIPMEQAPLGFPMEEDGVPLINARATFYFYGTYLPARLGPSSFYIIANRDANGEILNGNDTYKLTIAGDAPARDFWSIIAYSALTKGFIRDAETVGFSSREMEALNVSDDGSVDVYFAPEAPRGWESNWIPTGEDWFGLFRLYGPEEAAFDKTFVLPNIEKVE